MNQVEPRGWLKCLFVCGAGCTACLADGPVIIVDFVSGGTGFGTGSSA